MKTFFRIIVIAVFFFCCLIGIQAQTPKTQLTNLSIESKLGWAVWRTDYYICTGIAYAKSLGKTVNDFANFVGNKHSVTSPNDTSIHAVINTLNMLITTYPEGKMELLTESNSLATMKWERPYKSFFENGPVLGVSMDEFENFLYGHAAIMTRRIGIDFNYEVKADTIYCTLKRYR